MDSGNMALPHYSAQCHQFYGMGACNLAQSPPYNVYAPVEYEIAEQRNLEEQKEINEYYLDMNAVKEQATEQPPVYDTIPDCYEKPAYENWHPRPASPGPLPIGRDDGNPQYY